MRNRPTLQSNIEPSSLHKGLFCLLVNKNLYCTVSRQHTIVLNLLLIPAVNRIQANEPRKCVMYMNQMSYLGMLNGRRYMYEEYIGAVAYIWTWCA